MTTCGKAEEISERLRRDLDNWRVSGFPSLNYLSSHYETSRPTMTRAVQQLADEGLLVCRRGFKVRFPQDLTATAAPPRRAAEWLADIMAQSVETGVYRLGTQFPKNSYFTTKYKVSSHTVGTALSLLKKKGIARQVGRRWYVGMTESPWDNALATSPLVLFVQGSRRNWDSLVRSERLGPLCQSFMGEARSRGSEILFATQEPDSTGYVSNAGPDLTLKTIRADESRYAGAMLFPSDHDALERWANYLLPLRKPVVVFAESSSMSEHLERRPNLFLAHTDELQGIRLAVNYLASNGHRALGFFSTQRIDGWRSNRLAAIRTVASRRSIRVVSVDDVSKVPSPSTRIGICHAAPLSRAFENGPPPVRAFIRDMLYKVTGTSPAGSAKQTIQTLSDAARRGATGQYIRETLGAMCATERIAPLVNQQGITAVICANDEDARLLYLWLRIAGIDVPGRMSLISFDNYLPLADTPVTSVDFGLSRLGYTALNLILGNVKPRGTWKGHLPIEPSLSHRGSIRQV